MGFNVVLKWHDHTKIHIHPMAGDTVSHTATYTNTYVHRAYAIDAL